MRQNVLAEFDTLRVFLSKAETELFKGNNKRDDNRVLQHTKAYSDFAHLDSKLVKSYFFLLSIDFFCLVAFVGSKKDPGKCLCIKYFII